MIRGSFLSSPKWSERQHDGGARVGMNILGDTENLQWVALLGDQITRFLP